MGDTNDPPVKQSQEIKEGWRPEGWVNEYRQYTGIIADLETNDGNIGKCNPAECNGEVRDFTINCTVCGGYLGVLSMVYFGIPHHMEPEMCCINCLPSRLEKLEKDGYKSELLERVRKWLGEKP